MRFLVRIRGAFTPPPRMEVPVMKMPLYQVLVLLLSLVSCRRWGGGSSVEEGLTMQRRRRKGRCRGRCPCLPRRTGRWIRGIGRPVRLAVSLSQPLPCLSLKCSYVECFSFAIEEHVCHHRQSISTLTHFMASLTQPDDHRSCRGAICAIVEPAHGSDVRRGVMEGSLVAFIWRCVHALKLRLLPRPHCQDLER